MRFSRYAAIPLIAASSVPLALAAPAHAHESGRSRGGGEGEHRIDRFLGPLTDLNPGGRDVTDGAVGAALVMTSADGTVAAFGLAGLGAGAGGRTFGVHAHTGPCVAGEPDTAGPHLLVGETPSPWTELWLDVTAHPDGWGVATTTVAFPVPPGGARSIVVHAEPTDAAGDAGDRLACVPLDRP